uniref:Uncharacterized protein n=1 Tax=Anguilla anguilla TaxID=7936 RepID=A0A0E9WPD5_ANGAN
MASFVVDVICRSFHRCEKLFVEKYYPKNSKYNFLCRCCMDGYFFKKNYNITSL